MLLASRVCCSLVAPAARLVAFAARLLAPAARLLAPAALVLLATSSCCSQVARGHIGSNVFQRFRYVSVNVSIAFPSTFPSRFRWAGVRPMETIWKLSQCFRDPLSLSLYIYLPISPSMAPGAAGGGTGAAGVAPGGDPRPPQAPGDVKTWLE